MSEGMMFSLALGGCVAGGGMMFVDKVAQYLYRQTQKAGLFANRGRYGTYASALLAVMFQVIAALLIVMMPLVLVLGLIKEFSGPLHISEWFKSYGGLSVVIGMMIGVLLRIKFTAKTTHHR